MRSGKRHILDFARDRRGTAMLELAVVLPVLMAIGFGAIEFGNLIYKDHLLWNGVRDGARYLSGLPYDPSATPPQTAANQANAKNIVVTGVMSGGTARVANWVTSQVTVSYSTEPNGPASCGATKCYRGGDSIMMVTVRTDFPYQSLGFMRFLGLGSTTLTASHQERLIGNR